MKKIALQNLEVLLSNHADEYIHGLIPGSTLYEAASSSSNISFEIKTNEFSFMNDAEIINSLPQKFLSQLKNNSILFGNIPSKSLVKKLNNNKIKIIAQNSTLNHKWEDKNFFHSFCMKYSLPTAKGMVVKKHPPRFTVPCVLQEPRSFGGFGTYVAHTSKEYEKIISSLKPPYLYKEFIYGIPFGVTALISRTRGVMLSSVRMQASIKIGSKLIYHGVQWVPKNELSKKAIKNIEASLVKLTSALRKEKFYGIANIDFMLSEDQCFFIEVNPRLSGATWQLSQHNELLHGIDFLPQYEMAVTGKSISQKPSLPNSSFKGATFDFDALIKPNEKRIRKSSSQAGAYWLKGASLILKSHRIKISPQEFFILPAVSKGEQISQEQGAGVLLSEKPLYQMKNEEVSFTKLGLKIREASKRVLF